MKDFHITASLVIYNNDERVVTNTIESFLNTKLNVLLYLVANSPFPNLRQYSNNERIVLIKAHSNPGFGAGHNLAIKKAIKSKYHLVLNPDVSFQPGVLEELYHYMQTHPEVGNIMPKIFYPDGSVQRLCKLLPTPLNVWSRRFLPQLKWTKKLNDQYELKQFAYDSIMNIPNLSGCFMFLRNSILQKTGGFDERFFLYLEDIDLNRRIGQHAKTLLYPHVSITHHYQRGSYNNTKLLLHHIVSAIKYFNKWGWVFDAQRRQINKQTLEDIKRKNLATMAVTFKADTQKITSRPVFHHN